MRVPLHVSPVLRVNPVSMLSSLALLPYLRVILKELRVNPVSMLSSLAVCCRTS
jgi:hypothetical protein